MDADLKEEYPHLRSDEEVFFQWWLDDLEEEGLLEKVQYEEVKYTIFDKVDLPWQEQMATMVKDRKYNALQQATYTPDWILAFKKEMVGVLVGGVPVHKKKKPFFMFCEYEDLTDLPIVTIDVKGGRGGKQKNASEHTFPFKQKMMWTKFRIYVHTVRIDELFSKTFTPHRYFYTNKNGRKRKISKWEPRTLQQFLDERMPNRHEPQEEQVHGSQKSLFS